MNSFIVCGPESSGNRLLGAILVRAGLWGSGSTDQPTDWKIPVERPVMIISHHQVREWVDLLRPMGHKVTLLIPVREAHACASSMVAWGHLKSFDRAFDEIVQVIGVNTMLGLELGLRVELVPYESLCNAMLEHFLSRHGLRHDNLEEPLQLRGQEAPSQLVNQNAKHYVRAPGGEQPSGAPPA